MHRGSVENQIPDEALKVSGKVGCSSRAPSLAENF